MEFLFIIIVGIIAIPVVLIMNYNEKEKLKNDAQMIKKEITVIENKFRMAKNQHEKDILFNEFYEIVERSDSIIEKLRKYTYYKYKDMLVLADNLESYIPLAKINISVMSQKSSISESDEIQKLALLRSEGMISDHEFQAFSERFTLATGEKAKSVIDAISGLYDQHKRGAMSEGNYHAALWSLMDKLDRKT